MAKEDLSLLEILKKINKDQGEKVASFGMEDLTAYDTLSIGSPGLDFPWYNSFPEKTGLCKSKTLNTFE